MRCACARGSDAGHQPTPWELLAHAWVVTLIRKLTPDTHGSSALFLGSQRADVLLSRRHFDVPQGFGGGFEGVEGVIANDQHVLYAAVFEQWQAVAGDKIS